MRSRRSIARPAIAILAAAAATALAPAAFAQGTTAFTYQGSLTDNGAPASGVYDIRATLFSSTGSVTPIGSSQCFDNVQVTNGIFTIQPNFGDQFDIGSRYIEIAVRNDTGLDCSNSAGFVTLGPRTRLTPTPFATESLNSWYLGDVSYANYARTDVDEFFYGNVTMYEPFYVNDSNNIVGYLESTNSLGCRLSFESSHSARTWTIGATGGGATEGGDRFSIWDATSNVPGLVIEGASGNVGVGTTNPNQLLDVIDGRFRVATTAAGSGNVFAEVTAQEHGLLGVMNQNGSYYIFAGQSQVSGAADVGGQLLVCDSTGAGRGALQINASNNCTLIAQVKSFMVDNPDDDTTDLYYACVEGPEAAMYVRGTAQLINGEAIVTLPRHFTAMALAEGITVQITPLSAECNGIAVVKKGTDAFAVKELMRGSSNAEFDWEVKAVRSGFEDFQVVRPKGLIDPPKPEFVPVN